MKIGSDLTEKSAKLNNVNLTIAMLIISNIIGKKEALLAFCE